jgi:hypothetical protein
MKKYIILVLAVMLFGCGETSNTIDNVDSTRVETSQIGETCGGPESLLCGAGFECKREELKNEAFGICVDAVIDKTLNCDQTKAPVCAIKDRQKNGYLNTCEAERHGAKVLHEWFCKIDPEVKGNCEAQVIGIGNCEAFAIGYEFDGEKCVEVGVSGCEAEIPFGTLKDCQIKCL